ncbi:hypothetical protein NDU88_002001 [Pleurodeles waltl]|uniref:Uncharacterized protein n=1 Tax=Pleurodeles waltl TaxID=8319 RepID=A0AAV7VY16_PLEWA|nr:hypothetical protein NDU88_002001 [Pleurodeles waltl]
MTPTGFTQKRCRLPPIRADYRGTQTSQKPSGKGPGDKERKIRKRAQDHDRAKRFEEITGRRQLTKPSAGTRHGQQETATAVVSQGQKRWTRRQKNQQSGHALGRAWPWQTYQKPSGKRPRDEEQKIRKRAQDRDRTKRIEGITRRRQSTKPSAATAQQAPDAASGR